MPRSIASEANVRRRLAIGTVATLLAAQIACIHADNRQHLTVAENVEIPANRSIDLGTKLDLRTPGDNNEICLEPARPFVLRDDFSIAAPSGLRVVPKVRLLSGSTEYPLENPNLTAEALCLAASVGAEMKDHYDGVRIWSPAVLSLKRVQWNSSHK